MNNPIQSLMTLDGCNAMVLGGAGHIGTVASRTLAEMGAGVHVVDVDGARLDGTVRSLPATSGTHRGTALDLADTEALTRLVRDATDIDVLLHCAAFVNQGNVAGYATRFAEQTLEAWRKAVEVNMTSAFAAAQAAAPALARNGKGSIVFIGSIYGMVGPDMRLYEGLEMGNAAAYAASKGGMIHLAKWLSTVLAPDVRVNVVSPGGVERGQDPRFIERYTARTPMGRMADNEDFAGAVAFFASDMSRYVTGQNLAVDGGWTAW
jgi:NAD(P)-dependent dehydrogenase (short-subunit alcohol dehydrogenase family)